ncbi:undecaprenyl-diphosphatase [Caldisericum exile]|uniref:Phosphatase n=1 Tax=Caldisericum exile (strain DSM 21853 / NBRC 104410 / AZM16c01) TaxID=511051 RepID=A0A7U6JE22_CALEA|nr:undecaprenyl-diphosphatase [Caldisericum exile]BAL80271.1 putative phosphatase [Caldisericum exile AZM16c01]
MNNLDITLFNAINGLAKTHFELNTFMIFMAKYIVFLIPLYLTYLLIKKDFKGFLFMGTSVIFALLIGYITKTLFYHPRPFVMGLGIDLVKDDATSSFPSNHTTSMFAFATSLYLMKKHVSGVIALILGVLLGVARVYIGVHFPFDILGGIFFGTVFSTVTYYWIFPYIEKVAHFFGFDII